MEIQKPYRILLYYQYVPIDNPDEFVQEHLMFCREIGVKGRIIIAAEGINGTVSGTIAQTDAYIDTMHADSRFQNMVFKIDEATGHAFKRISVRKKEELVNFQAGRTINPLEQGGERLSPKQFHALLKRDDVVVIDGRNDYEYAIGHFKGAIKPDVRTFREFPDWVRENLPQYKNKKVIMYCTGGIRCEKLSGFFLQEGFHDVAQLDGGIVTYGKDPEVQGRLFEGKCYVFDERIAVPINQIENKVVGVCYHCGKAEDRYVNCANPRCHLQHICCPECEKKYRRSCSVACRNHPLNEYREDKTEVGT